MIQAWLDHVLIIVDTCLKVHVHETIVDAKVLHMVQMVINMEIISAQIFRFLSVSKLVVNAKI